MLKFSVGNMKIHRQRSLVSFFQSGLTSHPISDLKKSCFPMFKQPGFCSKHIGMGNMKKETKARTIAII